MTELDIARIVVEIPLAALAIYTVRQLSQIAVNAIQALRDIALKDAETPAP